MLQKLRQDVGSVRKEIRAEKITHRRRVELGEILGEFPLRIAPGEVGVALRVARLREFLHHLGLCESLAQENRVRVFRLHLGDDPFPKSDGLRVGIVHAEDFHAMAAPEKNHIAELVPEGAPVGIVEIQRIDILVFFRRVLGILDRAVGTLEKPLGMLVDIRVVGRAIDREVERDLQATLLDLGDEPVEILERAEFRRDIFVSTAVDSMATVADRVGHTGLAGLAGRGVVAPLAVRFADRMDRRKINHIEPHRLGVIDAAEAIAEGRARVGLALGGTRKKFIPRRKGRPFTVHPHRMKRLRRCGNRAIGVDHHQRAKTRIVREGVGFVRIGSTHFLGELF